MVMAPTRPYGRSKSVMAAGPARANLLENQELDGSAQRVSDGAAE